MSAIYKPAPNKNQAIILLHGFNSSKEEVGGFYERLASDLSEKNIAAYAPDLFVVKKKHLPLRKQYQIAKQAYEFLIAQGYRHIAVCGFSLGAFLAMKLAQEFGLKKVILLSPVFDLKADFTDFVGFDIPAMLSSTDKTVMYHQQGVGEIEIPKEFLLELQTLKTSQMLKDADVLAISGGADFSADNHQRIKYHQDKSTQFTSYIIPETDHIFNIFKPGQSKELEVISQIRGFL